MNPEDILNHMLRGFPESLTPLQRQRILDAMRAFSLEQLRRLDAAGLRIWPIPNSVPPEFTGMVDLPNLGSPAAYAAPIRVVRIFPELLREGRSISFIRHELAHAWDDLKNDENPRPLDAMPAGERRRRVAARARERRPLASDMTTPRGPARISISEMLARYRRRLPRRELSFANPSVSESHSASTPREFYAEGYSVFHGTFVDNQARLLHFAPELYGYLEAEARSFGMALPDRAALARSIAEQRLPAVTHAPEQPERRQTPAAAGADR